MSWPLSQDYNEAIQSPATNFADPDLRRGEAAANALGLPMPNSGNFADVYQVRCPDGSRWAVKCFTREAAGLRERYQEISRHLRQVQMSFTVDFAYLEQGIRVAGRWYPVLKMQWVEGLTLNQFVSQHANNPAMLEGLLQRWAKMAKILRAAEVAHCDLQHGNVLLAPGGHANSVALKLIDYDGMWVPALAGTKSGEVGHPNYQHPQRMREGTYNLEVDRFPLLLVATALRALKAKGKTLWEKYDNGDNLLFKETDLREPKQSALFQELVHVGDPEAVALAVPLLKSLWERLESAPLLEEVMPDVKASMTPARVGAGRSAAPTPPTKVPVTAQPVVERTFAFDESAPAPPGASGSRVKRAKTNTRRTIVGAPMWAWVVGVAVGMAAAIVLLGTVVSFLVSKGSGPDKSPVALPVAQVQPAGSMTHVPKSVHEGPMAAVDQKDPAKADDEPNRKDTTTGDVRRFGNHPGGVFSAAFSPDGRLAATGGVDKVIRVWDLILGKEVHDLEGHKSTVVSLNFSPDSSRLISGSDDRDKVVRIWDVRSGQEIGRLEGQAGGASCVAFSPDGHYAVSNGIGKGVRLWDVETKQEIRRFDPPKGAAFSAAFSRDGLRILVGTGGPPGQNIVCLWDALHANLIRQFVGHTNYVSAIAFSPDETTAVSAGYFDGTIRMWDLRSGAELYRRDTGSKPVRSVAFSPDGRLIISGSGRVVQVWDVQTGQQVRSFEEPEGEEVVAVAIASEGRQVICCTSKGIFSLRKFSAPKPGADSSAPGQSSVINSIGMKLVLIPAGKFTMGSLASEPGHNANEGPQHEVEIARAFYMGAYPVTKGQFAVFVKEAGYKTEPEREGSKETWGNPPFAQTDDHPVIEVTWNDAAKFCEWLSNKEKKTYELPTEAEWEYACRAGTTTAFYFGDDPTKLDDYAWHNGNSGNHAHPVGDKKPNPWGLYDMVGNVWQWCDGSEGAYHDGYIKDPKYPYDGQWRLTRGGSWNFDFRYCRSAFRGGRNAPGGRGGNLGFRVVLRLETASP